MGDNVNNNSFNRPKDKNLAFFTYGIFKPGEIAYSKIKKYIDCPKGQKKEEINYLMKMRDGAPILLPVENEDAKTVGYVLYFKDNEAYKIINETISNRLYRWDTIKIGTDDVNVLFGNDPENGSEDIKDSSERENYKGRNDPLFKRVLSWKEDLESGDFSSEDDFYDLQMKYVLLWSAIDRYCKLKYNKGKEHQNRKEFYNEQDFIDALDKFAKGKNYRDIYTTNGIKKEFDINEPKYCLNYYYTLRCNIVHRGKTNTSRDMNLLKQATEDLLDIFEYILDETFKED